MSLISFLNTITLKTKSKQLFWVQPYSVKYYKFGKLLNSLNYILDLKIIIIEYFKFIIIFFNKDFMLKSTFLYKFKNFSKHKLNQLFVKKSYISNLKVIQGTYILSTSKGFLSLEKAKILKLGGLLLFCIW